MSLRTEIGSTGDVLMPVLAAVCECVCFHIHMCACLVLLPFYILRYLMCSVICMQLKMNVPFTGAT